MVHNGSLSKNLRHFRLNSSFYVFSVKNKAFCGTMKFDGKDGSKSFPFFFSSHLQKPISFFLFVSLTKTY